MHTRALVPCLSLPLEDRDPACCVHRCTQGSLMVFHWTVNKLNEGKHRFELKVDFGSGASRRQGRS